jgi:hypothetical protein
LHPQWRALAARAFGSIQQKMRSAFDLVSPPQSCRTKVRRINPDVLHDRVVATLESTKYSPSHEIHPCLCIMRNLTHDQKELTQALSTINPHNTLGQLTLLSSAPTESPFFQIKI